MKKPELDAKKFRLDMDNIMLRHNDNKHEQQLIKHDTHHIVFGEEVIKPGPHRIKLENDHIMLDQDVIKPGQHRIKLWLFHTKLWQVGTKL